MVTQNIPTQCDDRLALLYHISQTFNSSLDLEQVLNAVIDEMIEHTNAERGFIILQEQEGELAFRAARDVNRATIEAPEEHVSHSVVEQVLQGGEPILTSNAQLDSRFDGQQSVAILGLTSVMCAPMKLRDSFVGVIYVENRIQAGIFSEEDLDLLSAIASSAATAIENARLYQMAVEKGRMERELQVAREVQNNFLPLELYQLQGWQISAFLEPAREVGGDFYDVFPLAENSRVGVVIADVCDKGVGAAMFMALFRSLIRAFANPHSNNQGAAFAPLPEMSQSGKYPTIPQDKAPFSSTTALCNAIELTNNYIALNHDSANMFATVFFGLLNPKTGTMEYINGGHEPPVIIRRQGQLSRLNPTGPALGLFPNLEFNIQRVDFEAGDTMLAFTDGILDALNPQGEAFGKERLFALLQTPALSTEKLLHKVKEDLANHVAQRAQFDDLTLLALKREQQPSR